jgi:hypothetical protein
VHTILKCKSFFVHVPWGVPSCFFRTLGWSYHNIFLCSIGFLDPLIGYFFCRNIFQFVSLLQSLDPQYSLISFPTIRHWICAFDFTHIMRNAHIMGELLLYWPSKFFLPFRQSMPMGEKFRGFKGFGFML